MWHWKNIQELSDEHRWGIYTCPAGELLTTNGRWYNKASGKTINRVKHYKTKSCLTCSLFEKCTRNKTGRFIERSEHIDLIDANKKRLQQNMELYRKRQAIVEHPFGVIKRQWDFYYVMTKKSIKHASADVGLIFTCYNLRRIFNLIDKNQLKAYMKGLASMFLNLIGYFKLIRRMFGTDFFEGEFSKWQDLASLNGLHLGKKQFGFESNVGF